MKRADGEKAEDFLMNYGKAIRDKQDSQRIDNLRKETDGLSFKPEVSKISERIVQSKQG